MADEGDDTLDAVKDRARKIGIGCKWRSDEHQHSWVRWNSLALGLTITSALFSGAAGATLLATAADGSWLSYLAGGVGVVAAVLVTVHQQVAPQAYAQRHSTAAAAFSNLASDYFHIAQTATDRGPALADLERVTVKRSEVNEMSPRPEMWAVRKVEKQRDRADARKKERKRQDAEEPDETRASLASP